MLHFAGIKHMGNHSWEKKTRGPARRCFWESAKADGGKWLTHTRGKPLANCQYPWHHFTCAFEIQNEGQVANSHAFCEGFCVGFAPGVRNLYMSLHDKTKACQKLTCVGQAPMKLHKALASFLTHMTVLC